MENNDITLRAYNEFIARFKLFIGKNSNLIINTLSNIFSMRIIGNKTHGDLAEIGIAEFINQFMYDFESQHVGKDLFRNKSREEDILVRSLIGKNKDIDVPISLKAYGDGPLQLSTDKEQIFYRYLSGKGKCITNKTEIQEIISSNEFMSIYSIYVMPLIYDEENKRCNIMVFDFKKAYNETEQILFIDKNECYDEKNKKVVVAMGRKRKHPIYLFVDKNGGYICEVRYGDASANALQRGIWTNTKRALPYFDSLTSGWIDYSINETLVKLFSLALNASKRGHELANNVLQNDIDNLKEGSGV